MHCSIDVLLLRGGDKGDAGDFCAQEIKNNPILEKLPYVKSLIEPDGPFGGAVYAFIFNQKGLMAGIGIQGSKITRIDD